MDTNLHKTIKIGGAGHNVYVVVENCVLYPELYYTYEAAHAAVITKHAEQIASERDSLEEGVVMVSQVDVDEITDTDTTLLYVEKEIYIIIQRYNVQMP